MKIEWRPSVRASALNAARHVAQGRSLASNEWEAGIAGPAQALHVHVGSRSPGSKNLAWSDLVGICEDFQNERELAESWLLAEESLLKSASDGTIEQVAGLISSIVDATRLAHPQLEQQLNLRIGPLLQQWDGYGAALMAHLGRMTQVDLRSGAVELLAIHPVIGGDGFASPANNTAVIEAMLTNPSPELPEVVRLAWLVSQVRFAKHHKLQLEKLTQTQSTSASDSWIHFADAPSIPGKRRFRDITALALLPATLASAEVVELARCDEATLQLALDQFAPRRPDAPDVSFKLLQWWETFLQTKPSWLIALTALSRALDPD